MIEIPSVLREAEHRRLEMLRLKGKTLDIGGDRRSGYHRLISGNFEIVTLNINPAAKPDIRHDVEEPLPLEDCTYDNTLLMNILEHVYRAEQLVREAHRILKPGGKIIIAVPFLFPIHSSPRDYWRFTEETLRRFLAEAGFQRIQIEPLAAGVFQARLLMIDRLLPIPLRFITYGLCRPLAKIFDDGLFWLAKRLKKNYTPHNYPLGYFCIAAK